MVLALLSTVFIGMAGCKDQPEDPPKTEQGGGEGDSGNEGEGGTGGGSGNEGEGGIGGEITLPIDPFD